MTHVIDTYELSPLQAGMLFHSVSGDDAGVYIAQVIATLHEPLDEVHFLHAWQRVAERHPILRSRLRWEGVTQPVQEVLDQVKIAVERFDWRALAQAERDQRFQALLDDDRARGFDLDEAPLLRLALVRAGEREHWVLWTCHHALLDGRSRALLLREVFFWYDAFSRGADAELPLPRPYRDYIEWLRKLDYAAAKAYWQGALSDFRAATPLVVARDRQAERDTAGVRGTREMRLSAALSSALRERARDASVTLNTLLQGAWALLLHRYSGDSDIVFGATRACRKSALGGSDDMVGMFINTLPIRVGIDPEAELLPWLQQLRAQQVALREYEHTALAKVQGWSDVPRGTPLFESIVVFENRTLNAQLRALGGAWSERRFLIRDQASFPLVLNAWGDDELLLQLDYSRRRFADNVGARMLGQVHTLLEGMAARPQARLKDLPILTEAERQQLLVEWNDTGTDYPAEASIHELFEAQAARTPDAVAVEYEGRQLTYTELDARANQLARYLARYGVGPEVMVGICVERSLEMVVGVLGILKAGGAYVPLDPDYPASRLAFMLEDTAAPVLLTQAGLRERLPAYAGPVVALDADWREIARERAEHPKVPVGARNLAYVMYTSGSTGRPKGTCIEHRSVVRLVKSTNYIELGPDEVLLQFAPISFDASTLELWGSLLNGAKLVVCPAGPLSLQELGRVIQERGVTTLWLTAALFHEMVDEQIESLRGVRQLLAGGETLSVSHVRRMLEAIGDGRLINGYGPTENTTFTCCHVMTTGSRIEHTVPIGGPISNTRVYVLDSHMQPVPVGVYGELYIGGAGLAREYLHQPQLTAEKFVPDPFSNEAGARLYRSGDRVRFRADGCIEFLGRIDHQVKIRGYRIELGEIESALSRHPAIREVVVLAREDAPGGKRLVAYVVPENAAADLEEKLRAHLRATLPGYMVPTVFVALDALPLTPNGKVDRKALPAPEAGAYSSRGYEAPVSERETTLAHIWADVLKVDRVGRHDHFFELGGHSLLAVSVIERMRRAGLHADVRTLFATPTLAALAAAVGGESGIVEVPPNRIPPACDAVTPEMLPLVQLTSDNIERIVAAVPGGAANVQDIYPLAPLQEGILFHHLLATEGDAYLLSALFGFDSRARLEGYLQALQAVIDRHDILRTAVLWEGLPEPLQVVWRQAPLAVEEVSLETGAGDVAQQLRARFDARHYRLDVRHAPLLRVFIAQDAANARWVMLQLSHHLAIDHVTLEVVRQEIQAHLLGQAAQLPAPLPFRNFVAQARLGVSREEHEAFFRRMLGDVDEPTMPFGLTDVQGDGSGIVEARRPVDASLARRLRERARALGVSAASVCHLAWAQVLSRVSGRDDVVFGTVLLGRLQSGEGADRTVGLFINTLPIRIRIDEDGVQDSVRHTHTLLAELLRHEHAPLALAQRCSGVAAPAPLFGALLNYRHSASAVGSGSRQAAGGIEYLGDEERTNYPFVLSVDDLGEGFALTAQVQSPMDPARICAFMHTALEQLVGALEGAPAIPACSLDVIPVSERRQLLIEWKVDRQALPAPGVGDAAPEANAVAPRTATEEMVMDLFRGVLERADFGVLDSFFDLGGHSLMAARLMSRLRTASGIDLPLRNLFERPTVAGIAEAIDALSFSAKSKAPARASGDREEIEL